MTEKELRELLLDTFQHFSTKSLAGAYLDISAVIYDTPDSKLKNLHEIQPVIAEALAQHILSLSNRRTHEKPRPKDHDAQ